MTTVKETVAREFKVLVAIRNYSVETKEDGTVYYKLEVQPFAVKGEESLYCKAYDIFAETTKFNVSSVFHKLWLKDKLSAGNILLLTVEHRISGVTTYVKDNEILTHDKTSLDVKEALQATMFDLIDVNETVDISKYLGIMNNNIRLACMKANNSVINGLLD